MSVPVIVEMDGPQPTSWFRCWGTWSGTKLNCEAVGRLTGQPTRLSSRANGDLDDRGVDAILAAIPPHMEPNLRAIGTRQVGDRYILRIEVIAVTSEWAEFLEGLPGGVEVTPTVIPVPN